MLLSALPLRRQAPRREQLQVCSFEILRPDAVRCSSWLQTNTRLVSTAAAIHRVQHAPSNSFTVHRRPPKPSVPLVPRPVRAPKYHQGWSPSRALALWLKHGYGTGEQLDHAQRCAAASRSARLSVVALQLAMKRAEAKDPTSLSDFLISDEELDGKLRYFARKGITTEDINAWLWILQAQDPAERVRRLAASDKRLPPFVIRQVLDSQQVYSDPRLLAPLYAHISRAICGEAPNEAAASPTGSNETLDRSTVDFQFRTTPQAFVQILLLLTHHCLRAWPASLPSIARLAERYILTMRPSNRKGVDTDLALLRKQTFVHNAALRAFSRHAPHRPLANLRHNWEAQKIILGLSSKLSCAPLIDQGGFRAIRSVLAGLRKSADERIVAARLSKSWPPFRQEFDGLDERRQPEKDYSRNLMAGILACEAGYTREAYDEALDVLGGAALGESPFVHSRSLAPKLHYGAQASLNVDSNWAARIKATRNAHEAWQIFQKPPVAGLQPTSSVYAQMFAKLFASEVAPSKTTLPGTGVEAHPIYEASLSSFEKARLQPPRPSELYAKMRAQGIKPVGDCLLILLKNAESLQRLEVYLKDSLVDKLAASTFLKLVDQQKSSGQQHELADMEALEAMPLSVFHACVVCVCNTLPTWRCENGPPRRVRTGHRMVNVMNLTLARLKTAPKTYVAPWHTILAALSRPHVALAQPRPSIEYEPMNRIVALQMFMSVYHHVKSSTGVVDAFMFDKLCLVLRRAVTAVGFKQGRYEDADKTIHEAHAALREAADVLSQRAPGGGTDGEDWLELPPAAFGLGPVHVQSYFRTLAYLGDLEELTRRVEWIIGEGLGYSGRPAMFDTAKDPDHPDHERLYIALVMFRAFVRDLLPAEMSADLEARLRRLGKEKGVACAWPTDKDVEGFMEAESHRGDESIFWEGEEDREEA